MNSQPQKYPTMPSAKPFLKWVGGKTQLLKDLRPRVPPTFGTYIEPFIGGGALFFDLRPQKAIIADVNAELINVYKSVTKGVSAVLNHLKKFKNTKEDFEKTRELVFEDLEPSFAATRTIYLNRACFRGIYRVRANSQFNGSYGYNQDHRLYEQEKIQAASYALQEVKIVCRDYREVLGRYACKGDFVFLDPPYLPVSLTSKFGYYYTKEPFTEDNQKELANEVSRLQKLGGHIMLTNSNHPLVHELYQKYKLTVVLSHRSLSSKGASRG